MANIKSAKKRITVIEHKTTHNKRIKTQLKNTLKDFDAAVEQGNFDEAEQKLRLADKKLKKAASKNIIHENAASRRISNLYKKLNAAKAE